MQLLPYAAETQTDPIWLRTLATVLPFVGTVLVAILTGPKLISWVKNHRNPPEVVEQHIPPQGPGVPAPVALAATERASTDPIIRLFIDDLHTRLSLAHEEAAELHRLRATDAATIARLTTEIADKEERLQQCEQELSERKVHNRQLMRRLEELKLELESTRRKLAICMEGYQKK